ncbi:pantoate--beta-alanine ligase [Alkalibacter mobilis]|uniref:pantoate--beta-alanine ligase n=1 Tax=Alkalibacter mobilis TaxID=2787712 RepID=UPI0018A030D6|nr:pantoate--beta-alanine ligase [Alkalibacter mobilis]MBF7097546.1 pantoate--beta-alanine ligase [Alkalibacter mobilis]
MDVIYSVTDLKQHIKENYNNMRIGFVPTMGFLHEGHLSLIKKAILENDLVVTTVFVNPTQFGQGEDFETYPRDLQSDMVLAKAAGTHIFFNPSSEEIYPLNSSTIVETEGDIVANLCGTARPGHFKGVATVITKFFNIIRPDRAYFGEKDAQQVAVIKKMAAELFFDVSIVECPTVRESDGLAKSSRNSNLLPEERSQAPLIFKALEEVKMEFLNGNLDTTYLLQILRYNLFKITHGEIDYADIVDKKNLVKIDQVQSDALVAVAVKFKNVRLIDNITLKKEVTSC